jgi:hypothetical protein
MTVIGLPPSFGAQRRILEYHKDLSIEIIRKNLLEEALRLKGDKTRQLQGHVPLNVIREDSRQRKREKVWCEHCSRFLTRSTPQS